VREHDVYSVLAGTPAARRIADTLSQTTHADVQRNWLGGAGPLGLRRSAIAAASLAFLLIAGSGVGARALMHQDTPAPASPSARAPAQPSPASTLLPPAPATTAAPQAESPAESTKIARVDKKPERPDRPAPAPSGSRLELAIAPWGEVLIDGKSRGVSPPLRTLEVPPGAHTVEIRNSTFPAHVQKVRVKPGEAVRIQHRFK
jgi:hypothetical protein